jgi:hypothetical protein
MRAKLAGVADDQGLAAAHHDALDGLDVAHAERVEARHYLDVLAVD